jgi:D-psicose/D-tagatose/L-ribulose 3-epimerase
MLFGAHAFIWAGEWTPEGAQKAIGGAAEAGLDFVEIPLLRPESMDITATRALLDRYGIGCTCSLGLPKSAHLPSAPQKAQSFLESAVDVAAGLEAPVLCGVLYAHLGTLTGRPPKQEELEDVARVLKNVARYAAERGVSLGVEAVNRYETYLINLAEQADAMLDRVGEPNVFVHLDT